VILFIVIYVYYKNGDNSKGLLAEAFLVLIAGMSFVFYLYACLESYSKVPEDYVSGMLIEDEPSFKKPSETG
jgi:hypothetical protein